MFSIDPTQQSSLHAIRHRDAYLAFFLMTRYLAERFPDKALWPRDANKRAYARSICAEMHAGFNHLRRVLHLDICARESVAGQRALDIAEVRRDVQSIEQIWERCMMKYDGPFLFGKFSMADAYFVPIMLRFGHTGYRLRRKSSRTTWIESSV